MDYSAVIIIWPLLPYRIHNSPLDEWTDVLQIKSNQFSIAHSYAPRATCHSATNLKPCPFRSFHFAQAKICKKRILLANKNIRRPKCVCVPFFYIFLCDDKKAFIKFNLNKLLNRQKAELCRHKKLQIMWGGATARARKNGTYTIRVKRKTHLGFFFVCAHSVQQIGFSRIQRTKRRM